MDLVEALRTRRAIRDFSAEAIDKGVIQDLVGAAVLAPSANNLQPWRFAVVNGRDRLHKLGAEAKRFAAAHLPAGSPLHAHAADPAFEIFHGAAALIIICAVDGDPQSSEDCCLAGENLMLAAHARGLGTCWIGLSRPWLNEAAVKAELGIPEGWHPVAPIVLGHRTAVPAPTARDKPTIVWCR